MINKTHLSINKAEERGFLHRDYIAHCHRWTYVVKWMLRKKNYKSSDIVDIGCGKEIPLAKTLYSSKIIPRSYVGVDVNKLELTMNFGKFPIKLISADFCSTRKLNPNVITCFEVLEHVEPAHTIKILRKMKRIAQKGCKFFISTPCWDSRVGAASNHINEMTYGALGYLLEKIGFKIDNHFGTFASIKDYKNHLNEHEINVFNDLREYYDSNLLSTIFAPLYPQYSRNVLWELSIGKSKLFNKPDLNSPWSSSINWEDLL